MNRLGLIQETQSYARQNTKRFWKTMDDRGLDTPHIFTEAPALLQTD